MADRVKKLHAESIKNLGKGTRKEMGQVRKDDFRKAQGKGGKK